MGRKTPCLAVSQVADPGVGRGDQLPVLDDGCGIPPGARQRESTTHTACLFTNSSSTVQPLFIMTRLVFQAFRPNLTTAG
jgi:hypothetical protein